MQVSTPSLTPTQTKVLEFMRAYLKREDNMPSYQACCDHFKWSSINSAKTHILQLILKGRLERSRLGNLRFKRLQRLPK